jgi:hypothetical protein
VGVMEVTGRHMINGVTFRAAVTGTRAGSGRLHDRKGAVCDGRSLCEMWKPVWSFCPRCGTSIEHEMHIHREHRPMPSKGAFGGMYIGMVAAPILIISGVMLCLTGWGIFFGVPFILLGILAPLYGPLVGMREHRGKCPFCGTRMISIADSKEHDCPVCNRKFAIEDQAHIPAHS